MKKLFITLLFGLSIAPSSISAQSLTKQALDSLANKYFNEQNYEKSLALRQRHLEALKQEVGDTDSVYIMTLIQVGKCYYRMNETVKAIDCAQQVVDRYGRYVSQNDENYAFLLDNLALYQSADNRYAEGLKNAEQALAIYQRFYTHDHDLAVIYERVAELSHHLGDHAKAVRTELMALNVLKKLYGEHSQEYLDEAPYLQKYYEANGNADKAEALASRLETLAKETNDGIVDLPEPIEFESAEQANAHNNDALRCIKYYLNHYVTADQINEAAQYILRWSEATSDSHVVIGENEAKMMNQRSSMPYAVAYLAGCGRYALETGEADFTLDTYKGAMVDVLNFYQANKQHTGTVKYLEQYIKTYEKGRDRLEEALEKNFPGKLDEEKIRRIKNGETVKVEK